MNNEEKYNLIIDTAYKNYLNNYSGNFEVDRKEFINVSKKSSDFSEYWGLKIEERELTWEERYEYMYNTNVRVEDGFRPPLTPEMLQQYNIPTKLITITYNNETVEVYE